MEDPRHQVRPDDQTLRLSDSAPAAGGPRPFGRYQLLERLGRGGWGEVWKAFDPALARHVAVKLLVGNVGDDERARFAREAQLIARLQHPNIVSVFDHGRVGNVDFIAMQFVDGAPLSTLRLSLRDGLTVLRDAARAVEAAHQAGLIHRDLKPANLMVESKTGRAFVLDFGLARSVQAGSSISATGTIMGTPQYMPPEQAAGEIHVDARADVYGLGATLYDVVTGQPPFDADHPMAVLRKVLDDDPTPPRRINARLPLDVELIIQRAMEKSPARRYPSAAAFADDVDRHLRGDPIEARRAGLAHRIVIRVRKHPVTWALAAALVLAVIAGAIFGGVQIARRLESDREARAKAELAATVDRALALLQELDDLLDGPDVSFAEIEPRAKAVLALTQKGLASSPSEWKLWYYRGKALQHLGDDRQAERAFTRAIELGPTDGRPWADRGLLYVQRFQSQATGSTDPQREKRIAAARRKWIDPARADFEAAGSRVARDQKDAMELWLLLLDDNLGPAESAASARIDRGGRVADFLLVRGMIRAKRGDGAAALKDYTAALDRRPGLFRARYQRAAYNQMLGRYDEAAEDLDAVLRVNPRHPEAFALRGTVHCLNGDPEEALVDLSRSIELDPESSIPFAVRAAVLAQLHRPDEALADCDRALSLDPDHAGVLNTRGNIYAAQKDYGNAVLSYTRSIDLDPDNLETRRNRALSLVELGRPEDAVKDLDSALFRDPDFVNGLSARGHVLYTLGRFAEAARDFRRAVKLQPNLAAAFDPVILDCEKRLKQNDF